MGSLEIKATRKLPKYKISEESKTKAKQKKNSTVKKKKKIAANSVSLYELLKNVAPNQAAYNRQLKKAVFS